MADCLKPVALPDARVLILGSVPGEASIAAGRYYAHPGNAFWPLMETLFGDGSKRDYDARVELVLAAGVALWDVLASAAREGSLDSAVDPASEVPNDIAGFLAEHPHVTHVFFNGAKAESSFNRHLEGASALKGIEFARLPSTSPAHAISFEAKLRAWRVVAEAAASS
jgi:hypoxanthine-DNA glycosylase